MLSKQLLPCVWYFKEGDSIVPFVPLVKAFDSLIHKWYWIGFRIDKSDNPNEFLIDISRSLDKKDLNFYKEYGYNDVLVEVYEEDIFLKKKE